MNRAYKFSRAIYRWLRHKPVQVLKWVGQRSVRLGGPMGFYSAFDEPGSTVLVQARQESRPVNPECLRIRCSFTQHSRQPWPIFWQKISPARLVGKSLAIMDEKKRLMVESVYGKEYGPEDPSYNYLRLSAPTRLAGPWTSIISRWIPATNNSYYHWLMDALPRLAILDRFPSDTGILSVVSLNSFQRDTMEILGLINRCRPTPETHLVLESYYHSSFPTMTGCDNPYALKFLRDRFLGSASQAVPSPEKIYISRLNSARSAHEEAEMIDILKGRGWTILRMEDYSFREQMGQLQTARAVCAIHGAGLTNLLWCSKGCKVLEICPHNFLNGCYESIAAYLDLDYRYLVFDADWHYRMRVDLKQFVDAIKEIERDLACSQN
jgi:hypothetical protein